MKQNLTETITLLNRTLAPDFRLMPLYTPDCPVFLAVAWPGSDGVTGLRPRLPAGRGLTLQQALVAAGAEAVELRASLAQRHLTALADLPRENGLAMVVATDLHSGDTVRIPAQAVYLDCADQLCEPVIVDAGSTGCAAGATLQDARMAGLWECIERDAVALWWHGGLPGGALSLEVIDRLQPRLFWWLNGRDRQTRLLDLATDIRLPVVAAVSSDPGGGRVAVGTAARPVLADAALAAVTEMIQTEVGMAEARLAQDPEVLLWDARGSTRRQPQFAPAPDRAPPPPPLPLPPPLPPVAEGADLIARLAEMGHRVLAVELTLPTDPLPSVRVIVPGLCAMGGRIDTDRFHRLCPHNPSPCMPEPY